MSLTSRARRLYSDRRLAAKWVLAVRFLRRENPSRWILDNGALRPGWSAMGRL